MKAKASEAGTAALGRGWSVETALIMAEFEQDEAATADLESVLMDEPDQLFHVAQQIRDDRAREAALAALIDGLKAEGKTIVDYAGHYADEENLFVTAANRADGEPATDEDANAAFVSTDYRGEHSVRLVITGWKELGFTPRHERYDGGSNVQKGPMTEEQKAERKTLIANNKAAESEAIPLRLIDAAARQCRLCRDRFNCFRKCQRHGRLQRGRDVLSHDSHATAAASPKRGYAAGSAPRVRDGREPFNAICKDGE